MDFKLSTCARCHKIFNKIVSEVCDVCQVKEDEDYSRIRDVLAHTSDLNAEEVAAEAGVPVDCVIRMLRDGRIDNVSHVEATCGRCGAPAISSTKRLCNRCLAALDRECAQAMHDMRQRMHARSSSEMNNVLAAVETRQLSRREQRRDAERPIAPPPAPTTGRMVVPQHLRKKS